MIKNKISQKTIAVLAIVISVAFLLVNINSVVAVEERVVDSYSFGYRDFFPTYYFKQSHPSSTVNTSAYFQIFKINDQSGYFSRVELDLSKNTDTAGSGNIKLRIEGTTSQAYNSSPNGTIFAEALNSFSVNDLLANAIGANRSVFYFNSTHLANLGAYYALVVYSSDQSLYVNNGGCMWLDTSAPTHPGYYGRYASSAWTAPATSGDLVFQIYVSDVESEPYPTPTPSPVPTAVPAALYFTLDMRGVGAVANPSSTTSVYGKEWLPKQGLGYTFNGHVWNYTNPYCNGAYAAYAGELRNKATGNTTVDAWGDLTADSLTEVTTGTLSNGYFQFGTSAQTQYDSVELYQAWRINGTVTGSTETYTTDFIVRWVEPGVVIVEPTGSAELPTPTPVGYQPVGYGEIIWYIVALIVVLLPAGILGVMFRFGAWGFIIGLAIGAGLGYMLMPTIVPLWLVFVVVIGIVGMLLKGTVMGGGTQGTDP